MEHNLPEPLLARRQQVAWALSLLADPAAAVPARPLLLQYEQGTLPLAQVLALLPTPELAQHLAYAAAQWEQAARPSPVSRFAAARNAQP